MTKDLMPVSRTTTFVSRTAEPPMPNKQIKAEVKAPFVSCPNGSALKGVFEALDEPYHDSQK